VKPNRSLVSIMDEMSDLNRIHLGRESKGVRPLMTGSYEKGRYGMLVRLLDEVAGGKMS
jgi:hypothetical protein